MNFAIIGPSGYIAPRHLASIRKLDGKIIAHLDLSDSNFDGSENSKFFSCQDLFFEHCENNSVDYVICLSPNNLHFSQIKQSLSKNIKIITEKPIVISKEHFKELETLTNINDSLFSIMQLRYHDFYQELKTLLDNANGEVHLDFLTKRKADYQDSWKVDKEKSGGILFNIGIHYIDLFISLLGMPNSSMVHKLDSMNAKGILEFEKIQLAWNFSLDGQGLDKNKEGLRQVRINDTQYDFSSVSHDLHYLNYKDIVHMSGCNFNSLKDTYKTIFSINEY
jgi:UDP-N-acetyl-2-amino-2-deoxyglucuronate dehydrogenase